MSEPPSDPPAAEEHEPVVELGPPISDVPWSDEFAQQSLEILIVSLDEGGDAIWLKPVHAASLQVGVPASKRPGDVVIDTLGWYDLEPRVVHSTSWRHDGGRLVLTYVAVVEAPDQLPPDTLERTSVGRSDLARGEATAPPSDIDVSQVIEHALRHLSWLLRDDPAIADAIPDWADLLDRYQPEPFRTLG